MVHICSDAGLEPLADLITSNETIATASDVMGMCVIHVFSAFPS